MIREDRFLISKRPYAVDLSTLRPGRDGWWHISAAWFRRRGGVTYACVGDLYTIQRPAPASPVEFLARYTDGRYGGDCAGR